MLNPEYVAIIENKIAKLESEKKTLKAINHFDDLANIEVELNALTMALELYFLMHKDSADISGAV